jgi:hypothetical protein
VLNATPEERGGGIVVQGQKRRPCIGSTGAGIFYFGAECAKEVTGNLKSLYLVISAGSREGSAKLPPPRDCNPDENRLPVTAPLKRDGKTRIIG